MAYRQTIVKTVYKNGVAYHAQRRETFKEARERRFNDKLVRYRTKQAQKSMYAASRANFFTVVFMAIFLLAFFSAASGSDNTITFTSFLNALADSPSIDTSWIKTFNDLRISSDWGVFDFLRDFINTLMDIVSVMLWIITGVAQLIVYVGYLFRVLFGG